MFNKILITNRGEIAVRIIKACHELGITACTIHSKGEVNLPHIVLADESYLLESKHPVGAYLDIKNIIRIAKSNNIDAVHPGYGFLSENSSFIKSLNESGITFIGPDAESVEMMGDKLQARQFVTNLGLPVIPGSSEPCKSYREVKSIAKQIGFPIMLKASAGGGGKGMRIVQRINEIERAFTQASEEAFNAFGDGSMYVEKFLETPRHIEVQIMADHFDNYFHLFERECSIQRRHQKIIEEAPANISNDLRNKLTAAAIKIAKACKYVNAGTVEFLVDGDNYYFLEMNTRLQVEHPVTEFITNIDVVKEQISIAANNKISFKQNDITISGHAVECRINSEDPFNNFFPSIGKINFYSVPDGDGIRIDSGVEEGSIVSPDFDPLIAKLVCSAKKRSDAIVKMKKALKNYKLGGILTNVPFHLQILKTESFVNGKYNINFLKENGQILHKKILDGEENQVNIAAVLAASTKFKRESFRLAKTKQTNWGDNE